MKLLQKQKGSSFFETQCRSGTISRLIAHCTQLRFSSFMGFISVLCTVFFSKSRLFKSLKTSYNYDVRFDLRFELKDLRFDDAI